MHFLELAAGLEPALSSLRRRCIAPLPHQPQLPHATFLERPAGVEPAISALATQCLTARLQPLIFWLREGDSNPFRLWCQRPLSCRWTIPEHFLPSFKHTSLVHVRRLIDIVTNWLASKASNLDFPRSERGVFPVTLLAINLGCAGGTRTRMTLINSQVLCQLRYRAIVGQKLKAPDLLEGRGLSLRKWRTLASPARTR